MKYLILILVASSVNQIAAQQMILSNEEHKLMDAVSFEMNKQSKAYKDNPTVSYGISPDLCPAAVIYKLEQPIRFLREKSDGLNIDVDYYYSLSDSTIRCATYTISIKDLGSGYDDSGNISSAFNTKFDEIVDLVSNQVGKPDEFDRKQREVVQYGTTFVRRDALWSRDNMIVKAYLTPGNKRIRVTQYWE